MTKVVATADSACVGFLRNRVETRPAKLDEVLAQVRVDQVKDSLYKAARKKAENAFVAIRKQRAKQQAKAFNSLTGVKYTNVKFTLSEPARDAKFQQAMMNSLKLKVGEIAAPMANLQMVMLVSRKAPDYKAFNGKEEQYMMIVRMQKAQQQQAAFMEELSAQCQLDPSVTAERQ